MFGLGAKARKMMHQDRASSLTEILVRHRNQKAIRQRSEASDFTAPPSMGGKASPYGGKILLIISRRRLVFAEAKPPRDILYRTCTERPSLSAPRAAKPLTLNYD